MPLFEYQAMDRQGQEVTDVIEASSAAEVQRTLQDQGYFITKIRKAGPRSHVAAGSKVGLQMALILFFMLAVGMAMFAFLSFQRNQELEEHVEQLQKQQEAIRQRVQ